MYKGFKKILSLCIAVVISLTFLCSCDNQKDRKTADEVVLSVTKKFCDAILDGDSDVVAELSNDAFDDESCSKVLKYYYNNPSWDREKKAIADVVLDSLTYRIDKNSVLASYEKGTGTVDVYFSFVDFEKCYKRETYGNLNDFVEDLKAFTETTFRKVTLDYLYIDDEWLLEDYEKAFIDVFTWKEYDFTYVMDFGQNLKTFALYTSNLNYDSNLDAYVDVSGISAFIDLKDSNAVGWINNYCYLYFDGDAISFDSLFYDFEFNHDYVCDFDAQYSIGQKYFPTGDYKIVLFDTTGNNLSEIEFKIVNTDENSSGNNLNVKEFVFGDSDVLGNIASANWWSRYNGVSFELDLRTIADVDELNLYYKIGDIDENFVYESEMMSFSSNQGFIEIYDKVDIDINDAYYLYVYDEDDVLVVRAKMFK